MTDITFEPEALEDIEALPPHAQAELAKFLADIKANGIQALVGRSRQLSEEEVEALFERIAERRRVAEQRRRN